MLIDINTQVPDDLLQFDVCIVGSGPAAITVAREISRAGLRGCLLESGGHNAAAKIQLSCVSSWSEARASLPASFRGRSLHSPS
jgi:choline dehydrogenase-like flavoprotein